MVVLGDRRTVWQNVLNTFIVVSDNRGSKTIDDVWKKGLPNATIIVYSCETEPPIVGKVSHMWISEKREKKPLFVSIILLKNTYTMANHRITMKQLQKLTGFVHKKR